MRKFILWLVGLNQLSDLKRSEAFARRWRRDAARLIRKMRSERRRLERLASQTERLIESHEEALKGQAAELEVLKEVTLPGLTQTVQMYQSQLEADTAIQVRRRMGASRIEEE